MDTGLCLGLGLMRNEFICVLAEHFSRLPVSNATTSKLGPRFQYLTAKEAECVRPEAGDLHNL